MAYWTSPLPYDNMDDLTPGDQQENYIVPVEDDDDQETSPAPKTWDMDDQGTRLKEGYYDEARDRASWKKDRKKRKKKKHRKREQEYEQVSVSGNQIFQNINTAMSFSECLIVPEKRINPLYMWLYIIKSL